jgi:hypothetical protein
VATAKWTGRCPETTTIPAVQGQPEIEIPAVIQCTDMTTFKIWAVKKTP